jgi:LysR family transcriptional regulator, carnitine catabolism transcriptional activator
MDLTVQQLRIVLAVADAGSFTAAGEHLHLAQSSLSRAVADVERRVGVTLLQRTTRRVRLTPEGREFVRVARDVVASFDRGMNHFAGFLDGTRGLVRIATLPSLAATLLPTVVSVFRQDHPEVGISIEDSLLGQVIAHVDGGDADLAITVSGDQPAGLTFEPIAVDEFSCVFPSGHRFGAESDPAQAGTAQAGTAQAGAAQAGAGLTWSDLHDEPFIAFDPASSVRSHVDRAFAAAGATPATVTEARNIAAVGGLVAAGLGVSAVPSLVLPLLEFARLEHRPLTGPEVTRSIGVVTDPRRPRAPAVDAFLHTLGAARSIGLRLPPGARWVADS